METTEPTAWIAIQERLPEPFQEVLCQCDLSVFVGCYMGGRLWAAKVWPLPERTRFLVTAPQFWQPLPPPHYPDQVTPPSTL